MKLRIKGNSLRYRLTRKDIADLTAAGYLEDQVKFADQALSYAIRITNDSDLTSDFKNNTITMFMPKVMLTELNGTDQVGFENNNTGLHLLVEKDFTCLENVTEDQSDNYPNPSAKKYIGQ